MTSITDGVCQKSTIVAVGLWDDFTVRLLSLDNAMEEMHQIQLSTDEDEDGTSAAESKVGCPIKPSSSDTIIEYICTFRNNNI